MKPVILLILPLFAAALNVSAQDKIHRQNGKVVEAKILEVGASEIKYRDFSNPDGPVYILETDRIKKIVYENGKEEKIQDNLRDPERYAGQANQAIKVNFLAPLYGYFEVAYEKSTGFGKSYELSLGIIGAGKAGILEYYNSQVGEVKRSPFGVFVSGGYKFGKLPNFILFGKTRATHLMQGTYVKPIVYLGHYNENRILYKDNAYVVGDQNVTFGALQLEMGKQYVMGDKLALDLYWGFGYGFDNKKNSYSDYYFDDNTTAFNYANARAGNSPGLSFTFGVKLGMLLKSKSE